MRSGTPAWLRAPLVLLLAAAVLLGGPALAAARLDPVSDAEDRLAPEAAALVAGRTSPQAAVRAQVATAFGRILTPVCVDPLLGMLHDRSPAVREAALFALGQFGWKPEYSGGRESAIADAVAVLLGDRVGGVRLAAVSALGRVAHAGVAVAETRGDRVGDLGLAATAVLHLPAELAEREQHGLAHDRRAIVEHPE